MFKNLNEDQQQKARELATKHEVHLDIAATAILSGNPEGAVKAVKDSYARRGLNGDDGFKSDPEKDKKDRIEKLKVLHSAAVTDRRMKDVIKYKHALRNLGVYV